VILTRRLASIDSVPTTMLYSALFGSLGLSALALPGMDLPAAWREAPLLSAMAGAWCAAQWLVIAAYRLAHPSRIAPFAYSQLVWAAVLGFAVFGHVPDGFSLAGMGIILASGLWAAWQSRAAA
jgi:drug/metabolite transporter (DMT)-like permease